MTKQIASEDSAGCCVQLMSRGPLTKGIWIGSFKVPIMSYEIYAVVFLRKLNLMEEEGEGVGVG